MPLTNSSKPGPRPTSCLTCRRRRKKCDLNRPHCERCLKGGFECLGYGDSKTQTSAHRVDSFDPIQSRLRPILPAILSRAAYSEVILQYFRRASFSNTLFSKLDQAPSSATIEPSKDRSVLSGADADHTRSFAPSIFGTGLRYSTNRQLLPPNDERAILSSRQDFDRGWAQNQIQSTSYRRPAIHRSRSTEKCSETTSYAQPTWEYFAEIVETLCTFIPPAIDSTKADKETYFVHIIHEYQLQRISCCFMTPPTPVRDPLVNRLMKSKTSIWAIYLGVKLFQALDQDVRGTKARGHIGWIDKFEQNFIGDGDNNSSLNDARDWLFAQLELVYLSFVMANSLSGYDLLRKALPKFLRLVAADPSLTTEHPNGNLVISFPRAFGALQHELKRFIFYDTTAALVLGVLPLVDYGYNGECDSLSHGFEWVHGVSTLFVETISQVNSWRAGSRVAPLDDWRNLECRALDWQPQPIVAESDDSAAESVARLAVQEGWRHVTLIYIYMAMCGVTSHDPRVQASIRQIVQLGETVADSSIALHMFTHYVVAGLGARYEKHRSFIREKLLSFKNKRVWLFRGPEFSQVLDHLWHGAGMGGAPVTWDDYIQSRCTTIPI